MNMRRSTGDNQSPQKSLIVFKRLLALFLLLLAVSAGLVSKASAAGSKQVLNQSDFEYVGDTKVYAYEVKSGSTDTTLPAAPGNFRIR